MSEESTAYGERRPVSADIALFSFPHASDPRLEVLLIKRRGDPPGWELPGGMARRDEGLVAAAAHRLLERASIADVVLRQVIAVGTPRRDPGSSAISVLHTGVLRPGLHRAFPASVDAAWMDASRLPPTAFDHSELIVEARRWLAAHVADTPVLFDLLPEEFTLSELQGATEALAGRELDRRNFRRKILDLGVIALSKSVRRGGAHRPARLFRFHPKGFAAYAKRASALPFR